jgi:hypothetical protein
VTLRKLAKTALVKYTETPRKQWVLQHPAQLVLAVSQVHWCNMMESKLQSNNPAVGLKEFLQVGLEGRFSSLKTLIQPSALELSLLETTRRENREGR